MEVTEFEPNEEQLRLARAMAGFGLPHEDIAVLLDIDTTTLREKFGRAMERGAAEGTAKVAQSLFQMATTEKSVAAAIFWMKARAGWSEKHEVRVSAGSIGSLSDEELTRRLEELCRSWDASQADPVRRLIDAEVQDC